MKNNKEMFDGYIMIVDDIPENVDLLKIILRKEKYEVKAFTNSRFALKSALSSPPSLILLDIHMPDLDGFDFCRLFKENPDTADIPIIFLSALSETEDKIKAFDAGGVDYITKPFQVTEVLARISTHLELYFTKNHLEELIQKRTSELNDSKLKLLKAQNISHIGTWELDLATDTLFWTDEIYRIFGLEPQESEVNYELFLSFVHPEDREFVDTTFKDSIKQKNPYNITHRILLKDKAIKYVNEQGETYYDNKGIAVNSIGTVHDITEKYNMQKILVQNEKMLSIGGLAAGMAHEIRNPLSGISNFFQIIGSILYNDIDNFENNKAAEDAGTTIESIKHFIKSRDIHSMFESIDMGINQIVSIIDNMLRFSRKSEGIKSLVNLPELIDKVLNVAIFGSSSNEGISFKYIKIDREYEESIPDIMCDSSEIQQVILNIILNGAGIMMEYETEDPQFIISINYVKEIKMISIEIEDNGPGIPDKIRRRIFEPFFTTKPEGEGTGLGLSISYFIITEDHGGELFVESLPGNGAKFVINLPVDSEDKKNIRESQLINV